MEVDVPQTVVEPIVSKVKKPVSEAKKRQLSDAREKKANQKKVIEPDESSDDDTEPVKKKSKVITKSNSGNDLEQWGTTAIRTAALISLAGCTYYMQHVYGNPAKKNIPTVPPEPQVTPVQANMLPTVNRSYVGKSGFSI
jgi:uncharacterized membrane protein YdfJ with MMPL/SSD domain